MTQAMRFQIVNLCRYYTRVCPLLGKQAVCALVILQCSLCMGCNDGSVGSASFCNTMGKVERLLNSKEITQADRLYGKMEQEAPNKQIRQDFRAFDNSTTAITSAIQEGDAKKSDWPEVYQILNARNVSTGAKLTRDSMQFCRNPGT